MATVLDFVTDSLKLLGVVPGGGTPQAADAADALNVVIRLIDAYNADRRVIATITRQTHTWGAGYSSRTIGSAGQLVAQRPEWIEHVKVIPNGETQESHVVNLLADEWADVPDKARTGAIIEAIRYEPTYPSGTIYAYPVPTAANTLVLYVPTAFTSAVTLATSLSFAPGYAEKFFYDLTRRLAPLFRVALSSDTLRLAQAADARVARANVRVGRRKNDPALLGGRGAFDIDRGY